VPPTLPLRVGLRFHRAEAALELVVGPAQRGAQIDIGVAGQVGADEQQVAQFFLQARLVARDIAALELLAQLLQFLGRLVQHRQRARPVETDLGRARLQLHRPLPFRQAARDAGQCGGVLLALGGTLGALDRIPVAHHPVGIVDADIGEHVRVAALHLVADRACDLGEGKGALLLGHARMEHHLQQQVAQLVAEIVEVATVDRIGHLVGFLDGVRRDGREVLLQVPRAAALRVAQARHDRQQAFQFDAGGAAGGGGVVRAHAASRVSRTTSRATAGWYHQGQ
jgi:hypothetical protein